MSFEVKLYQLKKRDNSTKRPSGTGSEAPHVFNCILKHGSGILHPTISLDLGKATAPTDYNYAYISEFQRYYFIEEWYFDEALWTASLKVDVLATYRSEIGSANLYVMRAYSDHNGRVIDNLYPTKTECKFEYVSGNNPWNTTGIFVVGVVTANAAFGSLDYYIMDASQLSSMCQALTDPTTIIDTTYDFDPAELSTGLQLSLVDPIQYIKTCMMLPVAIGDITNQDAASTINVYRFPVGTGKKIHPTSRIRKYLQFTIKEHPDKANRGSYLNSAPYTKITLTVPPFGCIDIDSSVTCGADKLYVEIEVDPITGKGIMITQCNTIILNRLEAQIGVPISLSSVTRDYIGGVTSAVSGVAGAVGGFMGATSSVGAMGGAIAGGITGIGNAIQSLMPRANTIGTTGSFAANHGDCELDFQFFRPVDDDPVHNGRPLCAMRTISDLSGYVLVQDGDVSINGTSTEDAQIRQYLETGFYYE